MPLFIGGILATLLLPFCDYIEPLKPYGFLIGEIETERNELGFVKKLITKKVKAK